MKIAEKRERLHEQIHVSTQCLETISDLEKVTDMTADELQAVFNDVESKLSDYSEHTSTEAQVLCEMSLRVKDALSGLTAITAQIRSYVSKVKERKARLVELNGGKHVDEIFSTFTWHKAITYLDEEKLDFVDFICGDAA